MRFTTIAFLLFILAVSESSAQILYNFTRGDTLSYDARLRMHVTMSSNMPTGAQEMGMGFSGVMRLHRFAEDSVELWFDNLKVEETITIPHEAVAQAMQGQRIKLFWDARGGARNVPTANDANGLISTLATALPRLPAGGVNVGSVWSDTVKVDAGQSGVKTTGVASTHYKAVRDTVVDGEPGVLIEIVGLNDLKMEGAQGDMQVSGTQKTESKGTLVLLRSGRVAVSSNQHVVTGSTSMSGAMSMSADTRATIDTTMKLQPRR